MRILFSFKTVAAVAIMCSSFSSFAQNAANKDNNTTATPEVIGATWKNSLTPDGVYDRIPHESRILPWQPIREADVMWKKRVWREIDTRQKQNLAFRYPGDELSGGGMFIEILMNAIKTGKVQAFNEDNFTSTMTKDQLLEKLEGRMDTIPSVDPITQETTYVYRRKGVILDQITKFRIKEDWIFDRNLGRMVVRILGIAPLKDEYTDENVFKFTIPLFWIYYPNIRETLAQYEVYNPENDVARINWDTYFENRYFSSYIIKVSNPYGASFNNLGYTPMEQLYEAEKTNEMIFNKEHDMWVY
jgi:gliding motility associated protien GldN